MLHVPGVTHIIKKNMELIIYLLSGKTTNECRKYLVFPTPL
jgi:hypothetical protein